MEHDRKLEMEKYRLLSLAVDFGFEEEAAKECLDRRVNLYGDDGRDFITFEYFRDDYLTALADSLETKEDWDDCPVMESDACEAYGGLLQDERLEEKDVVDVGDDGHSDLEVFLIPVATFLKLSMVPTHFSLFLQNLGKRYVSAFRVRRKKPQVMKSCRSWMIFSLQMSWYLVINYFVIFRHAKQLWKKGTALSLCPLAGVKAYVISFQQFYILVLQLSYLLFSHLSKIKLSHLTSSMEYLQLF